MTSIPVSKAPQHLILATDLSARCDRAFDRSAMLAAGWNAKLAIVHAFAPDAYDMTGAANSTTVVRPDAPRPPPVSAAQVRQDIGDDTLDFELLAAQGTPSDVVLRAAQTLAADFVVTGTPGGRPFGRFIFGGTIEDIVRNATTPVLIVKKRPRGEYRDILVATDFSPASRGAILATIRLFPQARVTLLHCYETKHSPLLQNDGADKVNYQSAMTEYNEFKNTDVDGAREIVSALPILFERGQLHRIVLTYAAEKQLDLVVIGSQGKNALTRILFGSTAESVLSTTPCDVLVIPPHAEKRAGVGAGDKT